MKVYVTVDCPEFPEIEKTVSEHVEKFWPNCTVTSTAVRVPKDAEALLVIGKEPEYDKESVLLVEQVIPDWSLAIESLFLIDAKLGKLTHSDLIKTKVSFTAQRDKKISRRELFNFRSGFQTYSDAPFVFADRCDAKYGCSKCVDVCPAKSLRISEGQVVVSESECVRCGLCAENCPTSAIQLPKFSEDAYMGLLDGLNMSEASKKTLVLTCDRRAVKREPWMCVEEVNDIGIIGPRHLAVAAGSGIGAVVVYCADGRCTAKEKAREAVNIVREISNEEGTIFAYAEGPEGKSEIKTAHALSHCGSNEPVPLTRKSWQNYTSSLRALAKDNASASGLRLTSLAVSDACTLCGVCAHNCPHSALKVNTGSLFFDPSFCTGCGHCAVTCPEHAIELGHLTTVTDCHQTAVFQDEMVLCSGCGKPLESAKFLKKVATLLGKEDPTMKYCNDCKQRLAFEQLLKRRNQTGA